ncbi:SRPBCC family protein [Streptomyces sp. 796.1]|uniref:SRPBCC family protein n=1 Tax=Streptomyces sp. 796.1 TaxID=3163029 RepID=UPI0039C8F258
MIRGQRELLIHAPVERVWRLHTDVAAWPVWNSGIDRVAPTGTLTVGSSFRWRSHGLAVSSTVIALTPGRHITWESPAAGIHEVHRWTFTAIGDNTLARTEETWSGPRVDADPYGLRAELTQSLTVWLRDLKRTTECR